MGRSRLKPGICRYDIFAIIGCKLHSSGRLSEYVTVYLKLFFMLTCMLCEYRAFCVMLFYQNVGRTRRRCKCRVMLFQVSVTAAARGGKPFFFLFLHFMSATTRDLFAPLSSWYPRHPPSYLTFFSSLTSPLWLLVSQFDHGQQH